MEIYISAGQMPLLEFKSYYLFIQLCFKNDMSMEIQSFLKVVSGNCGHAAARCMITGH